jgi:hypothetical protein
MRKTFLLTSILLLSASWTLAQYSSGSSATDQNTSGSQSTGAYSGSSSSSQTTTTDDVSPGAQPSSSDSSSQGSQSSSSVESSSDQNAPQSSGGSTQRSQTSSDMSSQTESQAGASARAPAGGTNTGRTMTFEGCLSEANGKYHLTDKMGTSYELTGKTANLKGHVGHTIAVTGKTTSGENQPGAMSGPMVSSEKQPGGEQAGMEQMLKVSSFRHVSSKCKSSSTGKPGSTGSSTY